MRFHVEIERFAQAFGRQVLFERDHRDLSLGVDPRVGSSGDGSGNRRAAR